MKHTIKAINHEYIKDSSKTLHTFLVNEDKIFYVYEDNGYYKLFYTIQGFADYINTGNYNDCLELTKAQYNDDNYLISLFVKDFSKFTDDELLGELRSRGNAVEIWGISDVDAVIDDMNKVRPSGNAIFLGKIQKENIIKSLFQNKDKTADIELLKSKIWHE